MPRTYFNDNPAGGTGTPVGNSPTLTSGPVYNWNAAYGGLPSVPDPTATAGSAISGGLTNLPQLGQLGMGITEMGSAQAMQPLTASLPGLTSNLSQTMANITSLNKGQIPTDVLTNLQTGAAELGAARGMAPLSGSTNAAYLKALGLTGLELQDRGLNNMTKMMGAIPRGPQFNASSFLTSPSDLQNWSYLANTLGAAPIPASAAGANIGAFNAGLGRGMGSVSWPTMGMTGGAPDQSWAATHPGLTPGFPNPNTTTPDTGGRFTDYGNYDMGWPSFMGTESEYGMGAIDPMGGYSDQTAYNDQPVYNQFWGDMFADAGSDTVPAY